MGLKYTKYYLFLIMLSIIPTWPYSIVEPSSCEEEDDDGDRNTDF